MSTEKEPDEKKPDDKDFQSLLKPITPKLKRIGRVAKGETVVVERLADDLCDKFDKFKELGDDCHRAQEEYGESKKSDRAEKAKLMMYAQKAADVARHDLWISIHERCGFWENNIGVRDNYALVTMDSKSAQRAMINDFKSMLRRHFGGSIEGGISGFELE